MRSGALVSTVQLCHFSFLFLIFQSVKNDFKKLFGPHMVIKIKCAKTCIILNEIIQHAILIINIFSLVVEGMVFKAQFFSGQASFKGNEDTSLGLWLVVLGCCLPERPFQQFLLLGEISCSLFHCFFSVE